MNQRYFIGTHYRSLDSKGRLVLPQEYRDHLTEEPSFWLTGFYGHLTAYLPDDWEHIIEQFNKVSFRYVKLSNFKSKVIGLAQLITFDPQGRIRIPQPLLREAGLTRDCVLLGMYGKFEIWDQSRFEALSTDVDITDELDASQIELNL